MISAKLVINKKVYEYTKCNIYQQNFYKELDETLKALKPIENALKLNRSAHIEKEYYKKLGVIEYFLKKIDSYQGLSSLGPSQGELM